MLQQSRYLIDDYGSIRRETELEERTLQILIDKHATRIELCERERAVVNARVLNECTLKRLHGAKQRDIWNHSIKKTSTLTALTRSRRVTSWPSEGKSSTPLLPSGKRIMITQLKNEWTLRIIRQKISIFLENKKTVLFCAIPGTTQRTNCLNSIWE